MTWDLLTQPEHGRSRLGARQLARTLAAVLVASLGSIGALGCAGSPAAEGEGSEGVAAATSRGRALVDAGRYDDAYAVLLVAVEQAEGQPGPSLERAAAFYALADLYHQYPPLAEPHDAERTFERAQREYEGVLGPEHPAVGLVLVRRAEAMREFGDPPEAAVLDQRAHAIFEKHLAPDHPVRAFHTAGLPILFHPDEIARVRFTADLIPDASPAAPAPQITPLAEQAPAAVTPAGTYLQPNITRPDGTPGYLHVTEADMPWVVAIGYPERAARNGSRKGTRQAVIDAMKMWEAAIQPHLPWFRLAFVEEDPNAAVQVEWKRRITGPWAGFGGMRWESVGSRLRVGGAMEISTTPSNFQTLDIDEIALLAGHEFGHVIGLGHCLDCDSAMNYSWATRDRVLVTEIDVRTFLALIEQPNAVDAH